MNVNSGFQFSRPRLPEDILTYDGFAGQTITLRESIEHRLQVERGLTERSVTDATRKLNSEAVRSKFDDVMAAEYDEDFIAPLQPSFQDTKDLILQVSRTLGFEMVLPDFVVPDGDGGIRVEWVAGNRHLRIVCSNQSNYLYFEKDSTPEIIEKPTASELINKIRWLAT